MTELVTWGNPPKARRATYVGICVGIRPTRAMGVDVRFAKGAAARVGAEVTGVEVVQAGVSNLLVVGARSELEFHDVADRLRAVLPDEFVLAESKVEIGQPLAFVVYVTADIGANMYEICKDLRELGWEVQNCHPLDDGHGALIRRPLALPNGAIELDELAELVTDDLMKAADIVTIRDYVVTHDSNYSDVGTRRLFTLELGR